MSTSKRQTLDIFDAAKLAQTHNVNSFLEACDISLDRGQRFAAFLGKPVSNLIQLARFFRGMDYSVAILESVELTSGVYGPIVVVALRSMPKVN